MEVNAFLGFWVNCEVWILVNIWEFKVQKTREDVPVLYE